jgi:dihydrofolate reductase
MRIALIVAVSENGVIGNNNKLPWHLPEELKYFRKITSGKPIIMGRKTFESMGNRPLPHRRNIILTRSQFAAPDCVVVGSIEEALAAAAGNIDEVMVIGGAQIYQSFLPIARRIYLTTIHQQCTGDTYFPTVDWREWQKISEHTMDGFTVKIFDKRN